MHSWYPTAWLDRLVPAHPDEQTLARQRGIGSAAVTLALLTLTFSWLLGYYPLAQMLTALPAGYVALCSTRALLAWSRQRPAGVHWGRFTVALVASLALLWTLGPAATERPDVRPLAGPPGSAAGAPGQVPGMSRTDLMALDVWYAETVGHAPNPETNLHAAQAAGPVALGSARALQVIDVRMTTAVVRMLDTTAEPARQVGQLCVNLLPEVAENPSCYTPTLASSSRLLPG